MSDEKSIAHKHGMNLYGEQQYPDGLVSWRDAVAPNIDNGQTMGRLRSCGYCGSMHPADVAAAIRAGARGSFADWKYGWPHKAYFDGVPNPHAGMHESRGSRNFPPSPEEADKWVQVERRNSFSGSMQTEWIEKGTPAAATTYGKFYSVHLQDATQEDRAAIEAHLGLAFEFTDDGKVKWRPAEEI